MQYRKFEFHNDGKYIDFAEWLLGLLVVMKF